MYEPLDAEELAWVGRAVAQALADLHAQGLAHGSVDPRHVDLTGGLVPADSAACPDPTAAGGGRVLSYGAAPLPASAKEDVRALGRLLADHLALAAAARARSAQPGRAPARDRRA